MKLNDIQRGAINSMFHDYTEAMQQDDYKLLSMAQSHAYSVLCLIYNTGAPDPAIEDGIETGKFKSSNDVIAYIEMTT